MTRHVAILLKDESGARPFQPWEMGEKTRLAFTFFTDSELPDLEGSRE
jgi:hypothetical protein